MRIVEAAINAMNGNASLTVAALYLLERAAGLSDPRALQAAERLIGDSDDRRVANVARLVVGVLTGESSAEETSEAESREPDVMYLAQFT